MLSTERSWSRASRCGCAAGRMRAAAARGWRGLLRRRVSAMHWIAVVATVGHLAAAQAQFPQRPITLIVGSSPGGGVDRTARVFAQKLTDYFHQPVVVENRAGAGTRLAGDVVSKAAADGLTLLFTTGESTIDLAFDPRATPNILQDFAPVSLIAICQMLLVVNAATPVHSVQELLARSRAAPGKLNYSTAGVKTTMHLVGALFAMRTGADIVHIPYKGTVPALSALVARDVDMTYTSLPSALPFVEAGKLRALAVAGNVRSPLMPDIPTMAQSGVEGVEANIWYGLLAPAGTPTEVVETISRAVREVSRAPDYQQNLAAMGVEPAPTTPAAFADMLRDEVAKYTAVIKAAGIRAE
jgi:tripartite-type tricarboxylate transporter receptor subunit TctC